jgi:hypothetical protein
VECLVFLVLLLIVLILIIGLIIYIKSKISKYSNLLFGTANFFEGFNKQKEEFESEPKTPFGMESLLLPEINEDFPYMNVEEIKRLAEENILIYFKSIDSKELQNFQNIGGKIKEELQAQILKAKKESITIKDINIHKTVLNSYTKKDGICTIVFQTALNYIYGKAGEQKKIEDRINTEFIYVFDDTSVFNKESISLKCPNCGAPIKGLKHKVCPYCNAGLIDLAPKTLKFNNLVRK